MSSNGKEDVIAKIAEVPRKHVEKFNELYPQRGAWSHFVRTALVNLLKLHETNPNDLIDEAAKAVGMEDFDSGEEED